MRGQVARVLIRRRGIAACCWLGRLEWWGKWPELVAFSSSSLNVRGCLCGLGALLASLAGKQCSGSQGTVVTRRRRLASRLRICRWIARYAVQHTWWTTGQEVRLRSTIRNQTHARRLASYSRYTLISYSCSYQAIAYATSFDGQHQVESLISVKKPLSTVLSSAAGTCWPRSTFGTLAVAIC